MEILSFLYWVHTQDIIFDVVEYQRRYRETLFVLGDAYLTPLSQGVQYIYVQHMETINTRKYDTEGFVPVASLYGVVGSPSLFIRSLICRTGKI